MQPFRIFQFKVLYDRGDEAGFQEVAEFLFKGQPTKEFLVKRVRTNFDNAPDDMNVSDLFESVDKIPDHMRPVKEKADGQCGSWAWHMRVVNFEDELAEYEEQKLTEKK